MEAENELEYAKVDNAKRAKIIANTIASELSHLKNEMEVLWAKYCELEARRKDLEAARNLILHSNPTVVAATSRNELAGMSAVEAAKVMLFDEKYNLAWTAQELAKIGMSRGFRPEAQVDAIQELFRRTLSRATDTFEKSNGLFSLTERARAQIRLDRAISIHEDAISNNEDALVNKFVETMRKFSQENNQDTICPN